MDDTVPVQMTGDSVAERVGAVLRALAVTEPQGASTTDVARATSLPRPTVHRLLSQLEVQGLVERVEAARWVLGPDLFLMGLAAGARYDVRSVAQPWVRRLADATDESAFFSVCRGEETVCLVREDGAFPVRSHVLFEGARFPLGVASAGLVILAFMHPVAVADYLATADLAARFGPAHDVAPLRRRLAEARELGWAVNPGLVVEGSWGMAAAVFDEADRPIGALTLTGIETRFGPDRQRELGPLLMRSAHDVGRAIRSRSRGPHDLSHRR